MRADNPPRGEAVVGVVERIPERPFVDEGACGRFATNAALADQGPIAPWDSARTRQLYVWSAFSDAVGDTDTVDPEPPPTTCVQTRAPAVVNISNS